MLRDRTANNERADGTDVELADQIEHLPGPMRDQELDFGASDAARSVMHRAIQRRNNG